MKTLTLFLLLTTLCFGDEPEIIQNNFELSTCYVGTWNLSHITAKEVINYCASFSDSIPKYPISFTTNMGKKVFITFKEDGTITVYGHKARSLKEVQKALKEFMAAVSED